jgi:hypothetical protein
MRHLIANVAKKYVLANRQERTLVADGDKVRAYRFVAHRLAHLSQWPTGMSRAVSMATRRPRTALLGLLGSTGPQADQPRNSLLRADSRLAEASCRSAIRS